MHRSRRVLVVALTLMIHAGFAHADPGRATLYRDTWGTPHVYADGLGDAAFTLGYAQAEDRLEDIYKNVRAALGRSAEAFGPQHVQQDYIMRLVHNDTICESYWKNAPAQVRELGDSFMRGVEAFVAEHPERKPTFALKLEGWHCAAIQRMMILNWPLERIMDELHRKKDAPPFGSNSFAVAPARSAANGAIVMTDPHLTWEGMAVFYEARVHAGDYEMCGFWLVGAPLPALGHTGYVAWACTTGGPDTADVYMVKLNPKNPLQYDYNGEWRDFERTSISIAVQGQAAVEKGALYSLYGPVVEDPDPAKGVAYCGASPYLDAPGPFEQSLKMAAAKNCDEFYQALGMNQLMEQNVTFADRQGNIQYVRIGCVPIRPEGYNWSVPVPGGTDASRWKGIHSIGDLVQMKNPPQNYFQNCNLSPEFMMKDSPMKPGLYKPYIYDVTWDVMTPRGARLLELLDADTKVTKEAAMAYTLDVYDILAKPWQAALKAAVDASTDNRLSEPGLAGAVKTILAWDGQFTRVSAAAPIVRYWRLRCDKALPTLDIAEGKALKPADQAKLIDALAGALGDIQAKYGKTDIVWGDVNFIGRGGQYFPCPGTEFGGSNQKTYTETVMDVGTEETPAGSGKYVGRDGSSSTMVMFLHPDGIESYSVLNWGQSGDPKSKHYVDQAEKLYAERKFKPTWFKKDELMQHLESEKTIDTK